MKNVLSTKILTESQKAILNTSVSLTAYDAIKVEPVTFSIKEPIKNAIFTSKNAVLPLQNFSSVIDTVFCVGDKTEASLRSYGFNVIEKAPNAQELAERIVTRYRDRAFTFFCGNLRRKELPDVLRQNDIALEEVIVYETFFNKQHFQDPYDALLFFSPSAIQSFTAFNVIDREEVYCIGPTTAEEAKKHTNNVRVAHRPTMESTLQLLKKNL